MSDPLSLTPNEASKKLIAASTTLWALIGDLDQLERDHLRAKRVYDEAYAHAFRTADGSVDQRKYTATIETMHEREEMDAAFTDLRRTQNQIRWAEKSMDVWRTVAASVRSEWSATSTVGA